MGVEEVKQRFGVAPEQIPDLLALGGDKTDGSTFPTTSCLKKKGEAEGGEVPGLTRGRISFRALSSSVTISTWTTSSKA